MKTHAIKSYLTAFFVCLMVCGCHIHRTMENAIIKHDTCYVDRLKRDSIHVHDSIYLHEYMRQDTFFIERVRWRTQLRESIKHDSIYIVKTDTVTNTVKIESRRSLTGWQRLQMLCGRLALLLMLSSILIVAIRMYLRR